MPVVAAAVVPHSPLLLPNLAGRHAALFQQTQHAMSDIGAELYARQTDVTIIFTPHGPLIGDELTANVAEQYVGRMVEFGDQTTNVKARGASHVAQLCVDVAREFGSHLALYTREEMDYGCTVPLSFLARPDSPLRILPITVSQQPIDRIIRFCQAVEELAHRSPLRLALVASADLVLRGDHPDPRPRPLERAIGQAIGHVDPGPLLNQLDPTVCGLTPIIALLSCLHGFAQSGTVQSFQAPASVGLMTASIDAPS